jgi:hypothetical protein
MFTRQILAAVGPVLAGTAIGLNGASDYGPAVTGACVGLGVGLVLAAFVPDRREAPTRHRE